MHVIIPFFEMFSRVIVLLEYFDIFQLVYVVKILSHAKNSAYYACIMPNAFRCLLC